jgi:hypothetical protein
MERRNARQSLEASPREQHFHAACVIFAPDVERGCSRRKLVPTTDRARQLGIERLREYAWHLSLLRLFLHFP